MLAPPGLSRLELAFAFGQKVEYGYKSLGLKVDDQGDYLGTCELLPAYRVGDLLTLVDDFSIQRELDQGAPAKPGQTRWIFDDSRLAGLAERHIWSGDPASLGQQMADLFWGRIEPSPQNPALECLYDPNGHLVAVRAPYGEERPRVCEIVTRPLHRQERREVLDHILGVCRQLGFAPASDGSVHVHFDGEEWRNSASLCRLILGWKAERSSILAELEPNRATTSWRGDFPPAVVELAALGAALPFPDLALRLAKAGIRKRLDLNMLGLIRPRHAQHTLEARVFPALMDAELLLAKVELFEEFLGRYR